MTKNSPTEADTAAPVQARVLYASAFGKVNEVVTVTAEEAAAGMAAGELDTSTEAVAYALSLLRAPE